MMLHEEHFWTVVQLNGLAARLNDSRPESAIDPGRPEDRALLVELLDLLDAMIRHHAFEEGILFPVIQRKAGPDVMQLFADDHAAMGPFVKRVQAITDDILDNGMTDRRLSVFKDAVTEFGDYVMCHVHKEELALIQKLDTLIDADVDRILASTYADQKASALRRKAG